MKGLSQQLVSMSPDERQRLIDESGVAISSGGVVIMPTDTLYGVFVSATQASAELLDVLTARLKSKTDTIRAGDSTDQATHEPSFTLHLSDPEEIVELLELPSPVVRRLVSRLLPGPSRIVIEQGETQLSKICDRFGIDRGLVDAGSTIAFRVPDHPIARAVIRKSGGAVIARSLGSSVWGVEGNPGIDAEMNDCKTVEHQPAMVIDDGPTLHKQTSTCVRIWLDGRFEVKASGPIKEEEVLAMLNTNILFVCTGNTCRSPMAEGIASSLIQALPASGITIQVDSAGVAAGNGYPASQEAVDVLSEREIDLSDHQSKLLTPGLVDQADLIFTMTPSHAQAVMQMAPNSVHKVFPLDAVHPVGDPIGQPIDVYRDVADQLEKLITSKLQEIVQ
jgi:protein arginine phosphatase